MTQQFRGNMIETIQERVRNMVGPFYNMAFMLRDIENPKIDEYLQENAMMISEVMEKSIKYLIDMAKIVDKHLPENFDINKLLDKSKY